MNSPETVALKKDVGLFGIVSIGIGSAVGVSIFSVIAPSTALAGPAMLIALLIAMAPMIIFAIVYAFMGSALPVSGASYEWPRRFIHPFVGFLISWLRIAGNIAALIVLSVVLVSYLSMALPLPQKPTIFAIFLLVFVLNIVGVSAAARWQSLMLVILLATCAILVFYSAPHLKMENFAPLLSKGWLGVFAAIPLMITLFLGIESAVEVGGEIKNPGRNIPAGIFISVVLTAMIYFSVAASALGVLGEADLGASSAPLLDAANIVLGDWGKPLILVCATVAIGTSINAIFMIFARFLYAMGRTGVLPSVLARIHPRFRTPHVASIVAFVFCCLGLLLPSNLIFLFLAVNIPTLLKYGAVSISAARLLKQEPALYANARFRPAKPVILFLAYLGAIVAIAVIALGISADWRPYAALGGWAALGVIYYLLNARRMRVEIPAES